MGMSCIIKVCLILVTVVLQTDGKPPHIIFIVADDLGEFFYFIISFICIAFCIVDTYWFIKNVIV